VVAHHEISAFPAAGKVLFDKGAEQVAESVSDLKKAARKRPLKME
jgi:hypothetical protein